MLNVSGVMRAAFTFLTVLLVLSTAWLFWIGQVLASPFAPHGIVSFELAGDAASAAAILASWSERSREVAFLIQGFDYLYLLVYSAWFSLAARFLGARLSGSWQAAGMLVSCIVLIAAPLDAVENYALLRQLFDGASVTHASLAWWCAVPKFGLVVVAVAYLLVGGLVWLTAVLRR